MERYLHAFCGNDQIAALRQLCPKISCFSSLLQGVSGQKGENSEIEISLLSFSGIGDRGSTVVKVLCYKSEGCWFDPS